MEQRNTIFKLHTKSFASSDSDLQTNACHSQQQTDLTFPTTGTVAVADNIHRRVKVGAKSTQAFQSQTQNVGA